MTPALLMMIAAGAAGASGPRDLIPVRDAAEPDRWITVHDTVMGGRSAGTLASTEVGLVFAGEVSLAGGGGFASARTRPRDFGLSGQTGILIRVRGDGRPWNLRLRTDDRYDGVAWSRTFATEAGVWLEITLPFAAFEPVWRGRRVPDAGPLQPAAVRQLGFLIADRAAGPFRLEIARVAAY